MTSRRRFLKTVSLAAAALAAPKLTLGETAAADLRKKPNFVIILADDLGYGDIGCFGSKRFKTPNVDAIAKAGLRMTDFHSNGAVCSPTRAALLTGRYQQRSGITGVVTAASHRNTGLDQKEITFAEVLKTAGYKTALFGKWHTGYAKEFNPTHQGFDEFRGYVSGNVDFHSHIDQAGYFDWWDGLEKKDDKGYTTDLITKYGCDFIRRHKDKPFCLYLPHEAPHSPLQGRKDPAQRSCENGVDGKLVNDRTAMPKDKADGNRRYTEMIEVMDEGIGKVLATLRDCKLEENTIVLFFSDNGPAHAGSAGVLKGRKGSIFEGGHRVPACVQWPGKIKAGTESAETMMGADVLATLADAAGAKLPAGRVFDGVSLMAHWTTAKPLAKRDLFWGIKSSNAIRSGKWKLIVSGKTKAAPAKKKTSAKPLRAIAKGTQLYDLTADIGEKHNVAAKNPDVVKALRAKLAAWTADVNKGVKKRS